MWSTNIVWWESFGRWKLSLNFPVVHPALYFALFFFFDWEKIWLDMFTFCTFLSISLFLSLNFFFVHPASHKRLCLQTLDLAERKVGWTCLYFALFFREKLIRRVYILHFFERKVDWTCILHFFNVDWTCLHFAFFWERKLMGQSYILRENLIRQT